MIEVVVAIVIVTSTGVAGWGLGRWIRRLSE